MNKKSVAIVGFANTSLKEAKHSKADEMWSVNFAWDYGVPRIDRLFEIHPVWQLAQHKGDRDRKHLKYLQRKHKFPIYTDEDYTQEVFYNVQTKNLGPEIEPTFEKVSLDKAINKKIRIPNSIRFPFEKSYELFALLHRENKHGQPYFTNTIAYMMALAIMEGFERIELYGVEMAAGTEYAYQKACLEYFIGMAQGRGIEIYLPEHCSLMNAKLYHKSANTITSKTIESHIEIYKAMQIEAKEKFDFWQKQFDLRKSHNAPQDELNDLMVNIRVAHENAFIDGAAIQVCRGIIDEISFENPIDKNDDSKMVSRQNIEAHLTQYEQMRTDMLSKNNYWRGQLDTRKEAGETKEQLTELLENLRITQENVFNADSAIQAFENMIKAIDIENPTIQLVNKFSIGSPDPKQQTGNKENQNDRAKGNLKGKRKRNRKRRS